MILDWKDVARAWNLRADVWGFEGREGVVRRQYCVQVALAEHGYCLFRMIDQPASRLRPDCHLGNVWRWNL